MQTKSHVSRRGIVGGLWSGSLGSTPSSRPSSNQLGVLFFFSIKIEEAHPFVSPWVLF